MFQSVGDGSLHSSGPRSPQVEPQRPASLKMLRRVILLDLLLKLAQGKCPGGFQDTGIVPNLRRELRQNMDVGSGDIQQFLRGNVGKFGQSLLRRKVRPAASEKI